MTAKLSKKGCRYHRYHPMNPIPAAGVVGGAMVLGKLPVLGRHTIWTTVGQGSIALAVGAGG